MSDMTLIADIDTSVLRRMIPEIVAFGRRTMVEQSVTSAAYIVRDAQRNTAFVEIGRIDAELEVQVTPMTKTGRPTRAKKPRHFKVTTKPGVRVPMAVLIVMARTRPDSAYSRSTGNRWPLQIGALPRGKGSAPARQEMIRQWIQRMTMRRHSSTHFLQHGWTEVLRQLLDSPYFRGVKGSAIKPSRFNLLNTMSHADLGDTLIDVVGDACLVTSENRVGEGGNAVLDAKHREALIRHGSGPLQAAIDREAIAINVRVQEYLDAGMRQNFQSRM